MTDYSAPEPRPAPKANDIGCDQTPSTNNPTVVTERYKAAHRKRRIICYNDGNDCVNAPKGATITPENFLSYRTAPLLGTHVDSVFYCTGVFNHYTHRSRETELLTSSEISSRRVHELTVFNTDSLEVVSDFAHNHDLEIFWSMRMNDTQDAAPTAGSRELLSRWKQQHQYYLMGTQGQTFPYANAWSAINYDLPEVREKVLAILTDVAARYDIDGIELDFLSHPIFFKSQMFGQGVSQDSCDQMTELLQQIFDMTETVAKQRKKPLIIAVRVPGSIDFSAAIGLDVQRWLKEKLIDILVVSEKFQLNPWNNIVTVAGQYDVPIYPCLSGSQIVTDTAANQQRMTIESYRARAMRAWQAGVDGVCISDPPSFDHQLWQELGDPEALARKNKDYFVAVESSNPCLWLKNGRDHQTVPILTPDNPIHVTYEQECRVALDMPEDIPSDANPDIILKLQVVGVKSPDHLCVFLNDNKIVDGKYDAPYLEYQIDSCLLKNGGNCFSFMLTHVQSAKIPCNASASDFPVQITGHLDWPVDWTVFGPLDRYDPMLDPKGLKNIPEVLYLAGNKLMPQTIAAVNNEYDFAAFFGGTSPDHLAYVFVPLVSECDQDVTIGMGGDYWLEAWVDGTKIVDTSKTGNVIASFAPTDHVANVYLTPGPHVLALRYITGISSAVLSVAGPDQLRQLAQDTKPVFHWINAPAVIKDLQLKIRYQ